jgi:lipoic acid synthetase
MDVRERKPEWLKVRFPGGPNYLRLKSLMREQGLHTVCEEAHCPNMGECWEAGTATFMILGDVCTRACGFCAVTSGRPDGPPDPNEPKRVAYTVAQLGLTHAVVTSVNRDDQPDGGAAIFADTIRWIRRLAPGTSVEVLIPDFLGNWDALATVLAAVPDILNHNTETVPRLYPRVRFKARYERTLELLERAGKHLPVQRYVPPEEFEDLRQEGVALGFKHVEAGPLVRSSYHAERQIPRGHRPGESGIVPLVLP